MTRVCLPLLLTVVAAALGCRSSEADLRTADGKQLLRLGYMPNVNHAPALWALESGAAQRALGEGVAIRALAFNAGPQVIEALFAGELDIAYVGPSPAINAHHKSKGQALRLVAGSTVGGSELVVRASIEGPRGLAGQSIASPALGNSQDVALRSWLAEKQLTAKVLPMANADALALFSRKEIAAAWVAEPWASRLVLEAGGKVLVDEKERWPGGQFSSAVVIASVATLEKRGELVRRYLLAHQQAIEALGDADAQALVAKRVAREVGKALPQPVLDRAFRQLSFSSEPLEEQLARSAAEAHRLGFLESAEVQGLVDLRFRPAAARAERRLR